MKNTFGVLMTVDNPGEVSTFIEEYERHTPLTLLNSCDRKIIRDKMTSCTSTSIVMNRTMTGKKLYIAQ